MKTFCAHPHPPLTPLFSIAQMICFLSFAFLTLSVLTGNQVKAQTFPTGFSQVLVTKNLNGPTLMSIAPDGRIFVSEQGGDLRVIKNGILLAQPFISFKGGLSGHVDLFGVAFDPNFISNHYIYIFYTVPEGTHNRISRFTANGDVALAGSEKIILNLDSNGISETHYGGTMRFGADGKLYVSTGDALYGPNSQNLDTYHGKVLRINPDGSVPTGNPFTTGSAIKRRIWSYGLRNPHTFSFQPGTGKLFVNDVGEGAWEEINDATQSGLNFGWPFAEGNSSNPDFTNPIYPYAHGTGNNKGCAITGGTFFNPAATNYPPAYTGKYFYLDHCSNWIDMLTFSNGTVTRSNFATNLADDPVTLEVGTDGNLYFISRETNALYKITYTSSAVPVITNRPESITVSEQNPAAFKVTATGAAPLTYQWRKNGANISGATNSTYKINAVTTAHAGTYSIKVSNASGSVISAAATLTVTPYNELPTATILTPVAGSTYAGGDIISFKGSGTDPENGTLGASAFHWYVEFHHNSHRHLGPAVPTGVTSGSFRIPTVGETSTDVFYRVFLVVTDLQGARDITYVDILPRTSTITFNTNPQGLQLTLDGQPFTTPRTVKSVEGRLRTIGVVTPQSINALNFNFDKWSQGGAPTQTFATPVGDVTYTANFDYLKINFQDVTTTPPPGWLRDFGQPYGPRTSANQGNDNYYGWKKRSDKTPVDLTANGRRRSTPADILAATLMHMQANHLPAPGNLTLIEGIWEAKVPNGDYEVTVKVGDGAYLDSKHTLNVEGINAINGFVPTSSIRFKAATVQVSVLDGLLTLDAAGGINTKINTVTIQPVVNIQTIKPVADATVRNGDSADTNYGSEYTLQVENKVITEKRVAYLKFPLNNISNVSQAKLRVYLRLKENTESIMVSTFGVENDAWTESGITWNNAPPPLTTPLSSLTVSDLEQYYDFDVTDFVKKQATGDKVVSLMIKDPSVQNTLLTFNSRRVTDLPPQLVLVTTANTYCGTSTLIAETFSTSAAANFTTVTGGTGSIAGGTYTLASPAAILPLGSLSVHNRSLPSDYTFSCDARVTGTAGTFDDFALVFDYQDSKNFYFAGFNETNNATTHGIFKNVNGIVTQLADLGSLITGNTHYAVRIERAGNLIKVYRNNILQASVTDATFTGGKVGLGSVNNTVVFDNLIVCAGSAISQADLAINPTTSIESTSSKNPVPAEYQPEITTGLDVFARPNPSHHYFSIMVKSSNAEDPIYLTVCDVYGRKVEARSLTANQEVTIGNNYIPGAYILKVRQKNNGTSRKLIKL